MSRTAEGLEGAVDQIQALHQVFKREVKVVGSASSINQSLEKAGRVDDFFELAELMCRDARDRNESAGGHFREEHQTAEGEAERDDDNYSYVSAWEWNQGAQATLHKEDLSFEMVQPSQRSYK